MIDVAIPAAPTKPAATDTKEEIQNVAQNDAAIEVDRTTQEGGVPAQAGVSTAQQVAEGLPKCSGKKRKDIENKEPVFSPFDCVAKETKVSLMVPSPLLQSKWSLLLLSFPKTSVEKIHSSQDEFSITAFGTVA